MWNVSSLTLFSWKRIWLKVKHFFDVAVLPELLGRWFSQPTERVSLDSTRVFSPTSCTSQSAQMLDINDPEPDHTKTYCYCKQGKHGKR